MVNLDMRVRETDFSGPILITPKNKWVMKNDPRNI